MGKRKSSPCRSSAPKISITLASLDAALDMLATDTFSRLDSLICKFENAAGIQVAPGQAKARWEEAVKRYWVMRSMEVLTCSGYVDKGKGRAKVEEGDAMMDCPEEEAKDENGRVVPKPHMGPVSMYGLCPDDEQQWRRWTPKAGDVVLVDLPEHGIWPGKVINRTAFFQGRSIPKGNHYFPVRIYNDSIEPSVTIKSRLLPFALRPSPPLLASPSLQSAYHHANSPEGFDALAHARELNSAHCRSHPGVGGDPAELKAEKEKWNEHVNWVMNERRAEKMRYLAEEREKRLASITVSSINTPEAGKKEDCGQWDDLGLNGGSHGGGKKKRRTSIPLPDIKKRSESPLPNNTIFGPMTTVPTPFPSTSLTSTPRRTASPALIGSIIRPSLSTPNRPLSPRRVEKRRSVYSGIGEFSPGRGRGQTWTPPRILPSGDETAPGLGGRARARELSGGSDTAMSEGAGVPSGTFDFVSPLGPVRGGSLKPNGAGGLTMTALAGGQGQGENGERSALHRSGSLSTMNGGSGIGSELDTVKEEEGEAEEGWTLVSNKKDKRGRGSSAPCQSGTGQAGRDTGLPGAGGGGMEEDMNL